MHQPPSHSRLRVDRFAGQQKPGRVRGANQRRHQRRMDHRRDPDRDFGHSEFGARLGDPQIAAHSDFQTAAEAPACEPGDDGDRAIANRVTQARKSPDERLGVGPVKSEHLVDVGAADERLLARPPQHDDPHVVVVADGTKRLRQFLDSAGADNVQRFGVDQLDRDQTAIAPDPDEPLFHRVHALFLTVIEMGAYPTHRGGTFPRSVEPTCAEVTSTPERGGGTRWPPSRWANCIDVALDRFGYRRYPSAQRTRPLPQPDVRFNFAESGLLCGPDTDSY